MKKFLKGRIFLLAICLGLVWVVTAGIAFGLTAVTRSLNATVNIRANSDFAFFSDAAASQLMTQVSLPEVEPGEESTFTVYVKNTSTVVETLTAGPNSVPPQVGTLTLSFDGQASKTLAPGAITRVVGTLTVLQTAESGPLNFSFSINAVQAASSTTPPAPTTTAPPTTTALPTTTPVLNGQQIFAQNCITCHSSGTVNTSRTRAELLSFIPGHRTGTTLSSAQVLAVATYLKP